MILWQFAMIFCTQQIFPVFYNYTPKRNCENFDIYANESSCSMSKKDECKALKDCEEIRLLKEPPFHSAVEEFDLFCDHKAYYATVVSTCQFLGVLFGTVIYGHLGDHFGRRMVSFLGITIGILFAMASGLSPSWPVLAVLRFIVGSSIACVLVVFYTFICELIQPNQRVFLRAFFNWGYARLIFTLICFICDHWRSAAIATAAVVIPVPLACLFILPESPKWLISKGKPKEAKIAAQKLQKFANEVTLFTEDLQRESSNQQHIYTMKDLLSDRKIAKRAAVLGILWFSTSLSAFGSDLNSRNLAGNFYANQFVSGAVTALAKIFIFIFDEKLPTFDRRKLYYIPQILMISCYASIMVLMIFVKEDDCDEDYWANWGVIILNIIGVSLIEITWDACYLVAVECFPTEIRTIGIGTCSLLARCGALLAPQMAYLSSVARWAPYGVVVSIGIFSLMIGFFFLPNTKGVDLGNVDAANDDFEKKNSPHRLKCDSPVL
ncbi:unnamed protein product, partial [Mesorhabditis belari]|uniref:Major facilitator superfamily (MFS) profile domain-containing protein n=1 Tax=Mesorhabditis belari TaxID=2138241 RepID=A0AAF3E7W0_9BILA